MDKLSGLDLISKKKISIKFILIFLSFAVILTSFSYTVVQKQQFDFENQCCDHLFYRSMAFNLFKSLRPDLEIIPLNNPLLDYYKFGYFKYFDLRNRLSHQPPYVYRIVSPLFARLVSYLLFSDCIHCGFFVLTIFSLIFTSFLFALVLYLLTDNFILALIGQSILFLLKNSFLFYLSDYILVDPLHILFLVLSILLMLKEKKLFLYLVFILGLFNKEVFGFMIISYIFLGFFFKKLTYREFIIITFIFIFYFLFRVFFPIPVNKFTIKNVFWDTLSIKNILSLYFSSFGILLFFFLSRVWFSRITLSLIPFFLGGVLTLFFASDHNRIVEYFSFMPIIFSVLGITFDRKILYNLLPVFLFLLFKIIFKYYAVSIEINFLVQFVTFLIVESFFLLYISKNLKRSD